MYWNFNRNYLVTRGVTDQGAQLVISVGAHCVKTDRHTYYSTNTIT